MLIQFMAKYYLNFATNSPEAELHIKDSLSKKKFCLKKFLLHSIIQGNNQSDHLLTVIIIVFGSASIGNV